jgi:hypothetical protein
MPLECNGLTLQRRAADERLSLFDALDSEETWRVYFTISLRLRNMRTFGLV